MIQKGRTPPQLSFNPELINTEAHVVSWTADSSKVKGQHTSHV